MYTSTGQVDAIHEIDERLPVECAGSGKIQAISCGRHRYLKGGSGNIGPVKIVAFTLTDEGRRRLKGQISKWYGRGIKTRHMDVE